MDATQTVIPPRDLGRRFARRDRFMQSLGAELVAVDAGTASVRLKVRDEHLNFNGTCHGGVIFSLADCAFGISSNSHSVVAAGINAHITYQSAASVGDVLTAVSHEVSRSRKLATYSIEVSGAENAVIATFVGTVYLIGKHHGSETDSGR